MDLKELTPESSILTAQPMGPKLEVLLEEIRLPGGGENPDPTLGNNICAGAPVLLTTPKNYLSPRESNSNNFEQKSFSNS